MLKEFHEDTAAGLNSPFMSSTNERTGDANDVSNRITSTTFRMRIRDEVMKSFANITLLLLLTSLGCHAGDGQDGPVIVSATANDRQPVTLMLNWYPEAEHGGYYAALVHGYFEDEGLDVTIIPGGPNAPVVQQAARGAVDFGITNADRIITARAQDANIKALFAPLANSPRCLLVHEDSGIEKFEQLENVTMMLSREHAWAQYLIHKLPLTGVKIVPNSASLAPFLADPRAAKQGYIISEPFVAKKQGAKVRSLLVADFGFNPYTSVLMTRDDLVDQHPELVRKMIAASRRGWQHYLADPAETNQRIHELNPEMGLDILEFGVQSLSEYCVAPDIESERFGSMTSERWTSLVEQMEELDMVETGAVDSLAVFHVR